MEAEEYAKTVDVLEGRIQFFSQQPPPFVAVVKAAALRPAIRYSRGVGGVTLLLVCPACAAQHTLRIGDGMGWSFEQLICHRCETIRSVAFGEEVTVGGCGVCGLQLEVWRGQVWRDPDTHVDRVAGPCPACFAPVSEADAERADEWRD
jgi:hypothetical protein